MHSHMRSFLDDAPDTAPQAAPTSPMIKLGNPAVMLPTNAITDLAVTSMQPVPTNPASPMQYSTMQPLAVVNPNELRRNDYEPGMRGLGADAPAAASPLSSKLLVLGAIAVGVYIVTTKTKWLK